MKASKLAVTTVTPEARASSLLLLSVARCRQIETKQRQILLTVNTSSSLGPS